MKVVAAKGLKCPREDNPRDYITDDAIAEVPESAYYLRLVADGSLVVAGSAPKGNPRERGNK